MRIMTRYILTELIKVFCLALALLTGMMLIILVVREALNAGFLLRRLPDSSRSPCRGLAIRHSRGDAPCHTTVYSRMSGSTKC